MDIRNWPIDQIMQLPDFCFGRRWAVGLGFTLAGAGAVYDISKLDLPDRIVIWGVAVVSEGSPTATNHLGLALGDIVSTSDAEFNALEQLFRGIQAADNETGQFESVTVNADALPRIREPVITNGRKLIGRVIRHTGASVGCTVNLIISSIPTEVPDCLF